MSFSYISISSSFFILFFTSVLLAQKDSIDQITQSLSVERCCGCELRDLRKNDKAAYKALMKKNIKEAKAKKIEEEAYRKQMIALEKIKKDLQPFTDIEKATDKSYYEQKNIFLVVEKEDFDAAFYEYIYEHRRLYNALKNHYVCLWLPYDKYEEALEKAEMASSLEEDENTSEFTILLYCIHGKHRLSEKQQNKVYNWLCEGFFQSKN